mmetsp:Transcript_31846/g.67862  ORF Transcript_31846/g.67862 Transcript_31846/m.67862 type:complete len:117 (-) Transcript_31846:2043-2393(-)
MGHGCAALRHSSFDDDDDGMDEGDRGDCDHCSRLSSNKCCHRPRMPALRPPLCRLYLLAPSAAAVVPLPATIQADGREGEERTERRMAERERRAEERARIIAREEVAARDRTEGQL